MDPSALMSTVAPTSGVDADWMANTAPASTSLSFERTFTETGVFALVPATSSTATGASFTGWILRVTVAVAVPPFPSDI